MIARVALALATAAAILPSADAPLGFVGEPAGIGDPNPYYADGGYAIFYLKNEGRHPFWLTQTRDLLDWTPPREVLAAGARTDADYWPGSGSVIRDPAGGYRLFYTGHHPERGPAEVVMQARAPALAGPWRKLPAQTFAGSPDYDRRDFRDPFVLWNAEARAWWMILATRRAGQAVIGRYVSRDLRRWQAAPPLYATASPLNLEVPDLFREGDRWFLLYSDQREASRQVRYLVAARSDGPYAPGPRDALDGRAFYAGKTAGGGARRRLFGWIAHKRGYDDRQPFGWGGDLAVHAVSRTPSGGLAISLPPELARGFTVPLRRITLATRDLGTVDRPVRMRLVVHPRPSGRLALLFQPPPGRPAAALTFDYARGITTFAVAGASGQPPQNTFAPAAGGRRQIDLVLDPARGLGIAYLDDERALSFRYYATRGARLTAETDGIRELGGTMWTHPTVVRSR